MKTFLKTLILTGFVVGLLAPLSAEAASKSATIRVSCTVVPIIQISSLSLARPAGSNASNSSFGQTAAPQRTELGMVSQDTSVSVKTNLGKNFQMGESFVKRAGIGTRLVSVTAL